MGASCPDLPEPSADYPGPSIQFAACAYGGFQHKLCYTELTDDIQEFLAEVTPSALRQSANFHLAPKRDKYALTANPPRLVGELIDEACYRKKENCTGDGDRHQPGERHSPVEPTGHDFLPYATSYRHGSQSLFDAKEPPTARGKVPKVIQF